MARDTYLRMKANILILFIVCQKTLHTRRSKFAFSQHFKETKYSIKFNVNIMEVNLSHLPEECPGQSRPKMMLRPLQHLPGLYQVSEHLELLTHPQDEGHTDQGKNYPQELFLLHLDRCIEPHLVLGSKQGEYQGETLAPV